MQFRKSNLHNVSRAQYQLHKNAQKWPALYCLSVFRAVPYDCCPDNRRAILMRRILPEASSMGLPNNPEGYLVFETMDDGKAHESP